MPDIYLYAGEANQNDITLSDPTVLRGGAGTIDCTAATSQAQSATGTLARTLDGTESSSQAQSSTGTYARTLDGTSAASHGQSVVGTLARLLDGVLSSNQGQGAAGTCERLHDGIGSTAQGQSCVATVGGIAAATINYQGDGKQRRKRKHERYELFADIEQTVRTTLAGPVVVESAAMGSAAPHEPIHDLGPSLAELVALSQGHTDLQRRVTRLQADLHGYLQAQRDADEDDDDMWMMS